MIWEAALANARVAALEAEHLRQYSVALAEIDRLRVRSAELERIAAAAKLVRDNWYEFDGPHAGFSEYIDRLDVALNPAPEPKGGGA